MMYYPMMVDLSDKTVTVVGGGQVAYRKCISIMSCCDKVQVVSIDFIDEFTVLGDEIKIIKDEYKEMYISNSYLVIAATNSVQVNMAILKDCKTHNIFCNVVNKTEISDFIVPSVLRRGDLTIAVTTSGKSPSLSRRIKQQLEEQYHYDYEEYVSLLGKIREIILQKEEYKDSKQEILKELVNMDLNELKEYYRKQVINNIIE